MSAPEVQKRGGGVWPEYVAGWSLPGEKPAELCPGCRNMHDWPLDLANCHRCRRIFSRHGLTQHPAVAVFQGSGTLNLVCNECFAWIRSKGAEPAPPTPDETGDWSEQYAADDAYIDERLRRSGRAVLDEWVAS